jgi:ABC-type lipoprotein export system ATPase subunit
MNIESEKLIANMIKKYFKKDAFIIVSHRPIFTTICKKTYFIKDHSLLPKETLL